MICKNSILQMFFKKINKSGFIKHEDPKISTHYVQNNSCKKSIHQISTKSKYTSHKRQHKTSSKIQINTKNYQNQKTSVTKIISK